MNVVRRLVLLLFLLPGLAWAQASTADSPSSTQRSITPFLRDVLASDIPITMEADRIDFDGDKEFYEASGNVVLIQGEHRLHGDRMTLDVTAGHLIAAGNVHFVAPEGEFRAQHIEVDLRQETAVIARAEFIVRREEATYFMRGRRIEKIGPERYVIEEGHYTTCDCGPEEADWMVTAEYIDVTFDGYAVVKRGRIYMQGLAVAYVPYGVFPAKVNRSTGFLWPMTGWASDDGYRIGIPFYWNIDRHTDATIDTDWYENRGTKIGIEHRYLYGRNWFGESNVDVIQDRSEGDRIRWAVSQEQHFNPTKRLFFRNKINLISDNEYVNDFPGDVGGRYDSFVRSDFIINNLWEDYDLNIAVQHYDDLENDDNSYTFQRYPALLVDAISCRIGALPLHYRVRLQGTNFYRPKISEEERALDAAEGSLHPYRYLTEGRRVSLYPELFAPLNFKQVATLTPYVVGEGTFYQLDDRSEDRTPGRGTAESGAHLFTRFERVFPTRYPRLRALKHQIEPAVQYRYRDEPDQDELPIFDGEDRLLRVSELSYGLTNRLFMRLFNARAKRFHSFEVTDLRVLHGYDFAEAERRLDLEIPDDERRPWLPWTVEWETSAEVGRYYLDDVLVRADVDYDTYLDEVSRFNVLTALDSVRDDAIGVEYRYLVNEAGRVDIQYLSGMARYHVVDFITLDYLTRYSFLDSFFVETRYGIEFHSLQDCWHLRLNIEQRELPEKETVYLLLADFTGLVRVGTAF